MRTLGAAILLLALVGVVVVGQTDEERLWLPNGAASRLGLDSVSDLAFSYDGKYLAVAGTTVIYIFDMERRQAILWVPVLDSGFTTSVSFAPDDYRYAATTYFSSIRMWNLTAGTTEIWSLRGDMYSSLPEVSIAFSPSGLLLATGDGGGTVTIRKALTGEPLHTLDIYNDSVLALDFSPDGAMLATGGGAAQLWEVATGERIGILQDRSGSSGTLDFSPDGALLAVGLDNLAVEVWEVTSQTLTFSHILGNSVNAVAFSPDGQLLAVAERGGLLRIYSASTGDLIHLLGGHEEPTAAIAFSPDGSLLVSGSTDGSILIWDSNDW
jgi:WD40 repeat protein